jgi:hypothetical protein
MIERSSVIKIYNEALGLKGNKGRLVRISEEGYYEVLIEAGGRNYSGLLPIAATVLVSATPEEEVATIEVER